MKRLEGKDLSANRGGNIYCERQSEVEVTHGTWGDRISDN